MACNDNVIKNIASEIARECQNQNVTAEVEFVKYLVELLLLNPKYGKMFSRNLSRVNLEFFVKECVSLLLHGAVPITTMKMQNTLESNYDRPQTMIDKHLENIKQCLKPLQVEILETFPETDDAPGFDKLMRKISIYIILASGLGNPAFITTLKEGMAALASVFTPEDLREFVAMSHADKVWQLDQLVAVVSGCRLFNRDCKKGGEGIPDLPFNLADAGAACLNAMFNTLLRIMERVNTLTSAVEEEIGIDDETQNVIIKPLPDTVLTVDDYKGVYDILAFYRQFEVIIRKLLSDVEGMVSNGKSYIAKLRETFEDLHKAVKYKAAVPVVQVFPYFTSIWNLWRQIQNEMFLVSTVNNLMNQLDSLQEHVKIPPAVETMLGNKCVVTDQQRLSRSVSVTHRLMLAMMPNYSAHDHSLFTKNGQLQYLGFCAMALCVGALIPGNPKVGYIKWNGHYYSFSTPEMAIRFGKDPQCYILEVLELARSNPCFINLLGLLDDVYRVRNVDSLVVRVTPTKKIECKQIQTELHVVPERIVKNYFWDLWEHKRRACQWSNIVRCQTHSTQTDYSHMRSEIQCQTFENRDKNLQTRRDNSTNVPTLARYEWGLRGQLNDKQHSWDHTMPNTF